MIRYIYNENNIITNYSDFKRTHSLRLNNESDDVQRISYGSK